MERLSSFLDFLEFSVLLVSHKTVLSVDQICLSVLLVFMP